MRKSVKVGTEICVYDFSMASVDQLMDVSYCVQCAAVFPIGVLFRLQVGFEDRFQNQHCRRLHNPIPDCRDGQRQLHTNTVSFWDGQRSGIPFTHFGAKASQYLRHGV